MTGDIALRTCDEMRGVGAQCDPQPRDDLGPDDVERAVRDEIHDQSLGRDGWPPVPPPPTGPTALLVPKTQKAGVNAKVKGDVNALFIL